MKWGRTNEEYVGVIYGSALFNIASWNLGFVRVSFVVSNWLFWFSSPVKNVISFDGNIFRWFHSVSPWSSSDGAFSLFLCFLTSFLCEIYQHKCWFLCSREPHMEEIVWAWRFMWEVTWRYMWERGWIALYTLVGSSDGFISAHYDLRWQ